MNTLLLSYPDLQTILKRVGVDRFMDELIERLTSALVAFDPKHTEIPTRAGFHYEAPAPGLIEWMPLLQKQSKVLMKVVGYHPDSPENLKLPTILSTLSQFDPVSGHLVALVDGTFLTAMRTGAASAIASRVLARPDSSRLGLIGCGAQAVTQLHAIRRLFDIREVCIFDTDTGAMDSLSARVACFGGDRLLIRQMPVQALVAQVDILCVATSIEVGRGPVFAPCHTRPWLHVNAVGSDFPGKIEIPKSLLEASFVCPDTREQAMREGECQQLPPVAIGEDLVAITVSPGDYAALREQTTVFDSTGWALEDQVALDLLLDYAREMAIGTEVPIECVDTDPRDIYEFLG